MPGVDFGSPAWWAAFVTTVLSAAGVADPGIQADVKSVIVSGGALVMAVYQWQHHRTQRHADKVAGIIAQTRIQQGTVVDPVSGAVRSAPPTVGVVLAGPPLPPVGQHEAPTSDAPVWPTTPPPTPENAGGQQ